MTKSLVWIDDDGYVLVDPCIPGLPEGHYEFPAHDAQTPALQKQWVRQLREKTWFTPQHEADLERVFRGLLEGEVV